MVLVRAKRLCLFLALVAAGPAHAVTLSTGSGDGSLNVGVDGYGSFGSSVGGDGTSDAFYDPVGAIEAAGTTFESGLAVGFGGSRPFLTTGSIGSIPNVAFDLEILETTATSMTSRFFIGALQVDLEQQVFASFEAGTRIGSVLNQVYTFTNIGDLATSFDVVRYIDGDLDFDGTIEDGGGRLVQGGSDVLFETDASSGSADDTTFVGITASGGVTPTTNRFEIASFNGLRRRVEGPNPPPLRDEVDGDLDGDGFIDEAYDVTMALRNSIALNPNQSIVYTTQTLFGNAAPPAPGSSESLPLLPTETSGAGAFIFDIATSEFEEGEVFFIDPDIAVGYTYTIAGAEFDKVQAPSLAAVADPDGYVLTFFDGVGDVSVALAAGELFVFDAALSITAFTLTGIDPTLGLDPTNPLAFVTGVAYRNATAFSVTVTQAPIVAPDVAPIPLPAAGWLLLAGLGALSASGRRARR